MANIDYSTKKRIADLLNEAKERELIYVDVLMKSANLAAFQVIEKRVQWFKKPMKKETKSMDLRDFFLDVLIDVIIGQTTAKLLQSSVESLLRPVIRSRQAYYVLPGGAQRASLKQVGVTKVSVGVNRDRIATAKKKAKEKIAKHLTDVANKEELAAFRIIPELLINAVTEVGSDQARGGINLPKGERGSKMSTHGRGDVSIVRILSSVDELVSMQTLAVKKQYNELITLVQYTDISEELAIMWIAFLEANKSLAGDTKTRRINARSYLLIWYEMAIWAHMVQKESAVSSKFLSKVYGGGASNRINRNKLLDPNRFKVEKSDDRQTIFQVPSLRSSEENIKNAYGVVQEQFNVKLPQNWLEYWINRFPYSFTHPDGPTCLEKAEERFGKMRPGKQRSDATKAHAYHKVLMDFYFMNQELEDRFRYLKKALGI